MVGNMPPNRMVDTNMGSESDGDLLWATIDSLLSVPVAERTKELTVRLERMTTAQLTQLYREYAHQRKEIVRPDVRCVYGIMTDDTGYDAWIDCIETIIEQGHAAFYKVARDARELENVIIEATRRDGVFTPRLFIDTVCRILEERDVELGEWDSEIGTSAVDSYYPSNVPEHLRYLMIKYGK